MTRLDELESISAIVEDVLRHNPKTRNSDDLLYIAVCRRINPKHINLSFVDIILNRKEYGYPAYTYVARVGRRLREKNPTLAGVDDVEGHRKVNEEVFREYSKA